jgi:hypothetical protein
VTGKPTVADLGVDPDRQRWRRSGRGPGTIEIAFVQAAAPAVTSVTGDTPVSPVPGDREDWVLMRVTGDPDGRVLVFDRNEWECFLDGARKGEFDDAASDVAGPVAT